MRRLGLGEVGARTLGVCLAALVIACNGDDGGTDGATTSESGSSTSASTTSNATTTMGGSATSMGGSMGESESGTATDSTTGSTGTTGTSGTTADTTGVSMSDPTMGGACGDGNLDAGEECDDGNIAGGDGCEPDCTITPEPVCGDGNLDPGEECDDGNQVDNDSCKNNCTKGGGGGGGCPAMDDYIVCDQNTTDWYKAFGIGCSDDPSNSVVIQAPMMNSVNANAWRIAKGFGTYKVNNELLYSPREGESFLMVSTGVIAAANGQGIVTEAPESQGGNGDNGNDDSDTLPAPMSHLKGSNNGNGGTPFMNCDGVHDCSDTLYDNWILGSEDPNNKLWFSFKAQVPNLVKSYSFNFAYFSSEWPFWVDTTFNDLFIAWQVSEAYTGNVTFIDGQPLTVTALDPYLSGDGYSYDEPQLQGTGFEGSAGSDWFGANQNVTPGETLSMTFFIADMGDQILATMAIVDNFRWQCDECIPADDPACTGEVPDPACCGVIEPQ